MGLRTVPLQLVYRSDHGGLVDEFYVPCLTESREYLRAAGYFTSRSLALVAAGLPAFIANGGYVRLVVSPQLEQADVDAMKSGYLERSQVIETALGRAIAVVPDDFERERLGFLAWLIARGHLDLRVAVRRGEPGIYHEKFGVFIDGSDDAIAFTGSPNETVGGFVSDFKSIDVFRSWSEEATRVQLKREAFEGLWSDRTKGVEVVPLPEAVRRELLTFAPATKPVRDPFSNVAVLDEPAPIDVQDEDLKLPKGLTLRAYQIQAIDRWIASGATGIWEMATGTGKTLAALAAATQWAEDRRPVLIVVATPLRHLVDQWAGEMAPFGLDPVKCMGASASWTSRLGDRLDMLRLGLIDVVSCVTTHQTLGSEKFVDAIERRAGSVLEFLIADEVHHLGAEVRADALRDVYSARLGLSATPRRWNDPLGDERLSDFFGSIVFEFSLKEAIRDGFLTPYEYRPILVELDDEEMDGYVELTYEIVAAWEQGRDDAAKDALLRKRSELLNSAHGKLEVLRELFAPGDTARHTLVYTTPSQLDAVVSVLSGHDRQRVHRFTYREDPATRRRLLQGFADGEFAILTAIRCLDEGVDVPYAYRRAACE